MQNIEFNAIWSLELLLPYSMYLFVYMPIPIHGLYFHDYCLFRRLHQVSINPSPI